MSEESLLPIDKSILSLLCQRHGIKKLSVFGSTLKGTQRPDSDIDLLVEFSETARPSLLHMALIELDLSQLMQGKKIDLRTAAELSRHFREEVVRTARTEYVAS